MTTGVCSGLLGGGEVEGGGCLWASKEVILLAWYPLGHPRCDGGGGGGDLLQTPLSSPWGLLVGALPLNIIMS